MKTKVTINIFDIICIICLLACLIFWYLFVDTGKEGFQIAALELSTVVTIYVVYKILG